MDWLFIQPWVVWLLSDFAQTVNSYVHYDSDLTIYYDRSDCTFWLVGLNTMTTLWLLTVHYDFLLTVSYGYVWPYYDWLIFWVYVLTTLWLRSGYIMTMSQLYIHIQIKEKSTLLLAYFCFVELAWLDVSALLLDPGRTWRRSTHFVALAVHQVSPLSILHYWHHLANAST